MNWLALECAELLCRAEQNTPVRRNAMEKIRQETGLQSFVADHPGGGTVAEESAGADRHRCGGAGGDRSRPGYALGLAP